MAGEAKALLNKLHSDREAIEREVEQITDGLTSGPNPPGLSGSLVDKEVNALTADAQVDGTHTQQTTGTAAGGESDDVMPGMHEVITKAHALQQMHCWW